MTMIMTHDGFHIGEWTAHIFLWPALYPFREAAGADCISQRLMTALVKQQSEEIADKFRSGAVAETMPEFGDNCMAVLIPCSSKNGAENEVGSMNWLCGNC
jgi:hypothetical protein